MGLLLLVILVILLLGVMPLAAPCGEGLAVRCLRRLRTGAIEA